MQNSQIRHMHEAMSISSSMQAAGICETLNGAGATQLLLALLSLHLDPACNLLGIDLEASISVSSQDILRDTFLCLSVSGTRAKLHTHIPGSRKGKKTSSLVTYVKDDG